MNVGFLRVIVPQPKIVEACFWPPPTGSARCSRAHNSTDLDLLHAQPGSFAIAPTPEMVDALKRDYQAMTGMIFGDVPDFAEVLAAARQLEHVINKAIE